MCGRDTLAMEVSSTSMNVASVTVRAISHGLYFGFQGASIASVMSLWDSHSWLSLLRELYGGQPRVAVLLEPNLRDYGHARPQAIEALLPRLEADAYRQALDDLHIVARRVFRREQTDDRASRAGHR